MKILHWELVVVFALSTSVALSEDFKFSFSEKKQVGEGTQYFTGRSNSPQCNVFVAEVDLTNPHIQVVPITPIDKVREAPSTIAKQSGAIVLVNSSFFSMDNGNPYGYFRKDGITKRTNGDTPFAVMGMPWRPGNEPVVANVTPQETAVRPQSKWKKELISEAIAGGPTLIVNGEIDISSEYASIGKRNPRTAIGFDSKTKKLYMTVIDGRSTNSVGMTFEETANFMKGLGCTEAINYDGGGSSAMIVNGVLQNKPGGGTFQRPVPLCWGVVPTTIIDDSTSDTSFRAEGNWKPANTAGSYGMSALEVSGEKPAKLVFETTLPLKGTYKVYSRWGTDKRASTKVPYTIEYAQDTLTIYKDQSFGKGQWQPLGTFEFSPTKPARVSVSNDNVYADEFVSGDAVKFEFMPISTVINKK